MFSTFEGSSLGSEMVLPKDWDNSKNTALNLSINSKFGTSTIIVGPHAPL